MAWSQGTDQAMPDVWIYKDFYSFMIKDTYIPLDLLTHSEERCQKEDTDASLIRIQMFFRKPVKDVICTQNDKKELPVEIGSLGYSAYPYLGKRLPLSIAVPCAWMKCSTTRTRFQQILSSGLHNSTAWLARNIHHISLFLLSTR